MKCVNKMEAQLLSPHLGLQEEFSKAHLICGSHTALGQLWGPSLPFPSSRSMLLLGQWLRQSLSRQ